MCSARNNAAHVFTLGPLSLHVLGYQFPKAREYWDANWLVVKVTYRSGATRLEITDPCVRTGEIAAFHDQVCALLNDAAIASLDTMEPYLKLRLALLPGVNRFQISTSIWIDTREGKAEFTFDVARDEIVGLAHQLSSIVDAFPLKEFNNVH